MQDPVYWILCNKHFNHNILVHKLKQVKWLILYAKMTLYKYAALSKYNFVISQLAWTLFQKQILHNTSIQTVALCWKFNQRK
jgi:hypothetical protein